MSDMLIKAIRIGIEIMKLLKDHPEIKERILGILLEEIKNEKANSN